MIFGFSGVFALSKVGPRAPYWKNHHWPVRIPVMLALNIRCILIPRRAPRGWLWLLYQTNKYNSLTKKCLRSQVLLSSRAWGMSHVSEKDPIEWSSWWLHRFYIGCDCTSYLLTCDLPHTLVTTAVDQPGLCNPYWSVWSLVGSPMVQI